MTIKYNLSAENKGALVKVILYNNETYLNTLSNKYERFKASENGVPIFSRTLEDDSKVNNKINNDFVGDVIDTKLGYMISIPVTYNYDAIDAPQQTDEQLNKPVIDIDSPEQAIIDDFVIKQGLDDLNLETVKMTAICGTSPRLCYINTNGEPAIMNLKPWEVVYIYNNSETELLAAVRYYVETSVNINNEQVSVVKAELYTDEYIYYFVEDETTKTTDTTNTVALVATSADFKYDESVEGGAVQRHGFNKVPIVEYVNNEERQGDCDKVIELMDVYDRCLSDQTSEVEQFRLAYLAIYGLEATDEDLARLKQTGAFKMTADGKVEFITKDMNATALENLLKQLEENIIKFARSVNFSDQNFFGNLSGIAIKYKLIKLEHKCSITEMKVKRADLRMWEILSQAYAKKRMYFDYYKIDRVFTRKIPVNLLEEARIQRELKGLVSNETRLALASFIDNPKTEIKRIEREMKSGVTFMLDDFYETLEEVASNNDTMAENDQYNEWRLDHRQSGKDKAATGENNEDEN